MNWEKSRRKQPGPALSTTATEQGDSRAGVPEASLEARRWLGRAGQSRARQDGVNSLARGSKVGCR